MYLSRVATATLDNFALFQAKYIKKKPEKHLASSAKCLCYCEIMFSRKNLTKTTLLCGPLEFTKSFVFEAAIHWAEEGHRVLYITPVPLQSLPATYHDRQNLSPAAFRLMRFMYAEDYETLVEQLVDLHTFEVLPSVLLIDDLDTYIKDPVGIHQPEVHAARLCAVIQDSTNACSRILKNSVHLCVSMATTDLAKTSLSLYFRDVWYLRVLSNDDNGQILELSEDPENCDVEDEISKVFNYKKLVDGTLILREICEKFVSHS